MTGTGQFGGTWVVDGANVVGARPDGWWRDRAAAARRLADKLAAARVVAASSGATSDKLAAARVVLVLEGVARAGVPAGPRADGVVVVHAPGEGDDEIVAQAAAAAGPVLVVTADRALRGRVATVGADVRGPGWLWVLLDAASPPDPVR